jgi:hypothetical protein
VNQIKDAKWEPSLTHQMGEWVTQVLAQGTIKTRKCNNCGGAQAQTPKGIFASNELMRNCKGASC